MKRLLLWLRTNAVNVITTAALLGLAVGFAIERVSLGFIVPSTVVLGLAVWGRHRG